MLSEVQRLIRGGEGIVPEEYELWQLCKILRCLPSEAEKESAYLMDLFLRFDRIEKNEQRLADRRASQKIR